MGLLRTICPLCGEEDSLTHLLNHSNQSDPPQEPDELVAYLVRLAECACTTNPHIPIPARPLMATEIDLDMGEEDSWDTSDFEELLFDGAEDLSN